MIPSRGSYRQLTRLRFEVNNIPRGEEPVWDVHLEEGRRVVGVDHHYVRDSRRRKTVDHIVWLWVEVELS